MPYKGHIPKIVSRFIASDAESEGSYYHSIIEGALRNILPENMFSAEITEVEKEKFAAILPHVKTQKNPLFPENQSFYVLAKYRLNAFKFFFEMISHWLVPGKRLNVVCICAFDFELPEISNELYNLCEIIVHVNDAQDLIQMSSNFSALEAEIKLGYGSSYYARKILEIKGVAADEKIAMVQEHVGLLIKRLPKFYDIDLLTEMQHILPLCRNEFKMTRTSRHIGKMIALQHLFRKALRKAMAEEKNQRHFFIKAFPAKLQIDGEAHNVLSIVIGMNFLSDKEILEKKHILQAIVESIPNAQGLENSFIANRRSSEPFALFYLEIEKADRELITSEEIQQLNRALPATLTERIEQLVQPVFMPRNEEEIMRNIISLSNEIRTQTDIPQVIITFDEQTDIHLAFTVIVVRVIPPGGQSIQEMFKKIKPKTEYTHDRVKMVGLLRKKQTKEATVFRLKLPKDQFLRLNHSLDLYKARQEVALQLYDVIGEFRDFNGGMMIKQIELLHRFKDLLGDSAKYSDLLLETFFFSLTPVSMQSILEPEALKILFLMLVNAIDSGFPINSRYRVRLDLDFIFLLVKAEDLAQVEKLAKALVKFNTHTSELAHVSVKAFDTHYEGYIYRCDEPTKQQEFMHQVENIIAPKAFEIQL